MSDIDVVAYLASKGLHGRQAGGTEVAYPCFFDCQEDARSKKRKLYVNIEDGYYVCFVCGAQGGTYLLQKHFGDNPAKPEPGQDPTVRRRILNWAADLGVQMLFNNDDAFIYLLNERGLSAETIIERKLGFVGNLTSLTRSLPEQFSEKDLLSSGLVVKDGGRKGQDFFTNHILIPYITRTNVVQIRGRQWGDGRGGKYMTGPGDAIRIFNVDDLDGAEDVIITEGEFDTIALKQHLSTAPDDRARKVGVVGLSGTNGFPDGAEAYFANVKRVFIGFDPDDPGRRAAVKLKDKFGSRARILELPADLPKCDWTEYLLPVPADADDGWHARHPHAGHTWQDVMALLGNAAGKRLFSIREAAASFRQQRKENPEGLKTGYKGLDLAILPGLLPGQLVVFLAKTGTGKTILLCNLAWNMREHPLLFVTLEMTREEVYDRLQRIALHHNPRWTEQQVDEAYANVWICDENRMSESDFENLIDEFEVESGVRPKLVFVDYLGYYARGAKGNSPYEKTSNAVMQLKAIAKNKKAPMTVVTPAQVNRVAKEGKPIDIDDARDSGAVEETADFLAAIWKPDEALTPETAVGGVQGSGVMKITLLKSRHGNKGKVIDLLMDSLTLAVVDASSHTAARVRQHNASHHRGMTYADMRAEETKPIQSVLKI